jgi:DNA repair ATPase RecN
MQICATLKALGKDLTILATSHQPAIAGISDVIYRIEAGELLETFPSVIAASE